jgi:hypothetical protein
MCELAERTGLKFDCGIIEHGPTPVLAGVLEVAGEEEASHRIR